MCLLVVEIAMLVLGIMALVTGKIKFSKNLVVIGVMARVIGVVLMLPLPLAIGVGLLIGVALVAKGQGQVPNQIPPWASFLDAFIVIGLGIVAVVLAAVSPKEKVRKKRPRPDDFDEDDEALMTPREDAARQPGHETGIRTRPSDERPPRERNDR